MNRTYNILNILLYIVAATGLIVSALSCQREESVPAGDACTLTYKVQLPLEFDTKAATAYEGAVNQLIYEVHHKNAEGNYAKLYQQVAVITNGSVELPVELVRGQDYMVLFWAQVAEKDVYHTENLSAVTLSDTYTGVRSGDFEAFFGNDHVTDGTVSENGGNIGLTRAVSQLNIATESLNNKTISEMTVTVKGISKTFNVMEGECEDVDPDAAVSYTSTDFQAGSTNISSSFIGFTPADTTTRVNLNFSIITDDGSTYTHDVAGVPVKPNYKSNITGNFITADDENATLVNTWAELTAAVGIPNSIIDLGNKTIVPPSAESTLYLQWSTKIKNGTLGCNVSALNNTITFSKVVFEGKFGYTEGTLSATRCTFKDKVTIGGTSDTGTTISFTNCDFNNIAPEISLSANYPLSNLKFSGTTNLNTLTIKANRPKSEIYPENITYLESLLDNNSFDTIECICTDGTILIN